MSQQVIIAQATLKGSVYYNSYMSALPGAMEGAVIRVQPGQDAELFSGQSGCTGCHSVSANGARMMTKRSLVGGEILALAPNAPVNPAPLRSGATVANFVGLAPDGSVYVNTAGNGLRGPHDDFNLITNTTSKLFETDSGTEVAGSGVSTDAMMPTFSASGSLLAFTDLASGGQTLALQDFDLAGRSATGQRTVYTAASGYPGWPFITPDDRAVIFALGSDPTFATGGGVATSDLYILDVAGGQATILARAMGYATPQDVASGSTYLPFGAEELRHHFYPTVSPVAAGGGFWIFFDSVRHYGNRGLERQLWGAALRVSADGTYAGDPSHPAFYLPGQEFGTDNHRAFAALDPCRADGEGCDSGVDCCSGFCTDGVCGPPQACAGTDEACTTSDDCCNPADICIGGFCGQVVVE